MYLYLYDSFLNDKKYHGTLAKIETRLTDLGVGGKIFRLSPLRNIAEIVKDEHRMGAKTFIVVGNDKTFNEILNVSINLDVTLGIIPVGGGNTIAELLGVNNTDDACNIIAARKIERLDVGCANASYFLTHITFEQGPLTIECDGKYKIIPHDHDGVSICNVRARSGAEMKKGYFDGRDGSLEVLIEPPARKKWGLFKKTTETEHSILPFAEADIKSKKSLSVYTEGARVLKTPVNVKVIPQKIKLIAGKHRQF